MQMLSFNIWDILLLPSAPSFLFPLFLCFSTPCPPPYPHPLLSSGSLRSIYVGIKVNPFYHLNISSLIMSFLGSQAVTGRRLLVCLPELPCVLPAALPSSLLSLYHVEYLSCKPMCVKQILSLPLPVACSVVLDYFKTRIVKSLFFFFSCFLQ